MFRVATLWTFALGSSFVLALSACGGGGGGGTPPTPPPPNLAPTSTSASITTNVGTLGSAAPSVMDPNSGDSHTYRIETQPVNGLASTSAGNTQLTYLPKAGFNGTDSFTFRATDAGGLFVIGTATVNVVNHAPSSASAVISTNMGIASTPVTPLVVDVDNDSFTFTINTQPVNGTATISNGQLGYQSKPGVSGADNFTFNATDAGGLTVVGTATVTVVNQAPTSVTITPITTGQGTLSPAAAITVSDPDTLQGDTASFSLATKPIHGLAKIAGNQLTYQSDPVYFGTDNFTVRATDAGGLYVDGAVSVTVTQVTPAPIATQARFPVSAVSSNLSGAGGGSPFINTLAVGDSFTTDVSNSTPANGAITVVNKRFVYTATNSTFSGMDQFTYSVTNSLLQTISGTALVRVYNATDHTNCTTPSSVNSGTLVTQITSAPCAIYGEVVTRHDINGNPITVRYIVLRPSAGTEPKGVVMMIGDGDLNMNISGNLATGAVISTGADYLMRGAQLLADGGYLVVVMDRPSDHSVPAATDPITEIDAYRVSVDHTVDILNILKTVNTDNLPVFLSGTGRGAISAVANNLIANRIELSSPVTTDAAPGHLYVGMPGQANLQLAYIQRQTYVVWTNDDTCSLSLPANSLGIFNLLYALGLSGNMTADLLPVTTPVLPSAGSPAGCGPLDSHGFMGIEGTVMGYSVQALDGAITDIFTTPHNHHPDAAYSNVYASSGVVKTIDLTPFASDIDVADPLSFSILQSSTVLGGSVTIKGALVTYTPPAGVSNTTDYFPFVVSDKIGAVGAAVIEINIGN